jgi:hypothetical protein
MASEQVVNDFLHTFKEKMEIWDVLFSDDRTKNAQALADWEVPPNQRKEALKDLKVEDYSEGPFEDEFMEGASLWVFGKMFNGTETYIKITMGQPSSPVICISFHPAEHEMKYPFKKQ